jgi:hypothetical protein
MEWVVLLMLGSAGWFWLDSMKAREAALDASRATCLRDGLQLLDDTVALAKLRPTRTATGRVALRRVYVFEFTDTGDNRRQGSVVLTGNRADGVELEPHRMQ